MNKVILFDIEKDNLISLLNNEEIKYIIVDNRLNHKINGDSIIRKNIRYFEKWYVDNKHLIDFKSMYKIVLLPKSKVMEDLIDISFIPQEWLLKMKEYYEIQV